MSNFEKTVLFIGRVQVLSYSKVKPLAYRIKTLFKKRKKKKKPK